MNATPSCSDDAVRGVCGPGIRAEELPRGVPWYNRDVTSKAQQVLREALSLPPRARADIAGTLLYSLDVKDDPDIEAAWAVEIERRVNEVYSGEVSLIPWEQVRRRLRAGLRRAKTKA